MKLPSTWKLSSLASITLDAQKYVPLSNECFTYIDISSIDRESKTIFNPQRMLGKNAPTRARKRIKSGDTLVSMTRPNLNAVALVPSSLDDQIASTGFDVLRPVEGIDPRWITYLVRTETFIEAMSLAVKGALYPAVRSKDVRAFVAPLAPAQEQKRIADKLDALLIRTEACKNHLTICHNLIKKFRRVVLESAVSGNLTATNRSNINWSSSRKKVPLRMLGELGRGKSKHRPRNDIKLYGGNYPFIQTGDIAQSDGFITTHKQTYSDLGLQQSRLWPTGTICITIAANIADTAILTYPACFPDSVVGFIANPEKCVAEFIKWSIDVIKDDLEAFAPATAQKNINLAVLNNISVNCPSLEEQVEIVHRVKSLFTFADSIEKRLSIAQAQVQQLSPLLLAKAFRGELIPQDSNDEPASELLKRISKKKRLSSNSRLNHQRNIRDKNGSFHIYKENSPMTKSRQDDNVIGKPYLAEHLQTLGGTVTVEILYNASELPISDFYKQLAWEVTKGYLRSNQALLELPDAAR